MSARVFAARFVVRCAAVCAVAAAVAAPSARAEGLLLGDDYRWANKNVLLRAAADVVAIPANAPRWEPGEWVQFTGWTAAVGTLMFAGRPVLDVRIDRWMSANLDGRAPDVWTIPFEATLWASIAVGGFGTWGWAVAQGNADVAQGMSLMGEALAVSQVYHLVFKLALGREGPEDGEGNAEILGPANAIRVYPSGTPSGHAATLFSLLSAGFAYFRPPAWSQVIGYALVGGVVAFHVINHKHFLSDSLWGAAMGWYVGQWVVRHRASWLFGERRGDVQVAIVPYAAGQEGGLALSGAF